MPLSSSRRRAAGHGLALAVLALVVVPAAASDARSKHDLTRVDLRVWPGDFKLAPVSRPLVPFVATAADEQAVFALSDRVEASDRVRDSEIPDRRREQNLLGIGAKGGLIEELLENQTIPLFWFTVEPPF